MQDSAFILSLRNPQQIDIELKKGQIVAYLEILIKMSG